MLRGRTRQSAELRGVLAAARKARSSALVLVGESGIGKSALLAYARERARGFLVLQTTGVGAEASVSYAGLDQLLGPVSASFDRIPEPQMNALRTALDLTASTRLDRDALLRGTHSILAVLAEEQPVLCTVDDVHLLDAPSVAALSFAARRLRAERIAILFARRDVTAVPALDGLETIELEGLDVGAARALLDDLRPGATTPDVVGRLVEATGGNPLALLEARSLLTDAQYSGRAPLEHPLPLGEELTRSFASRAEGLSADAQRALLVAAAADTQALRVMTETGAIPGVSAEALEECEVVDLVTIRDGRVAFRHPLARVAVYQEAPPAARRDAHRRLAAVSKGERRAHHLAAAAAGPDEDAARELERAGERALQRAGFAVAADWLERAADLTPEASTRARRLAHAARASCVAGRRERARTLAETGLTVADDADVVVELRWILDTLSGVERPSGDIGALFARAAALAEDGVEEEAARLLADGQAFLATEPAARDEPEILVLLADALLELGRGPPEIQEAAAAAVTAAAGRDAVWFLPRALVHRARVALLAGAWREADADAQEARRLGAELGQTEALAEACALLAALAARRGQVAECISLLGELDEASDVARAGATRAAALGLLDLGVGRVEEAIQELETAAATRMRLGRATLVPAVDLVEAYVRAGRSLDARAAAKRHADAGGPLGTAEPAWRRALVASGRAARSAFTEASVLIDEAGGPPFERARIELAFGERLRRSGSRAEAREHLRAAHDAFERLGAAPWVERARAELRATGETARRRDPGTIDELTPQELLVLRTIAAGASYREAGQALFLSPKTIEFHLGKVYRKLGVRSRRELLATLERLRAEGVDLTAAPR